jgi:hypothetical protein
MYDILTVVFTLLMHDGSVIVKPTTAQFTNIHQCEGDKGAVLLYYYKNRMIDITNVKSIDAHCTTGDTKT